MTAVRQPVDVNTFVGGYPFRYVPHPEPEVLVRVLAREGVGEAWVGHLPSAFHRDPAHGNAALYAALEPHGAVLRPVPSIRPDWPRWDRELGRAVDAGAPAVRVYPAHWGFAPESAALRELGDACGEAGLVLLLTVRFEDLRQRSRLDVAGDLSAAAVRELARGSRAAILVTAASRDFVEEVHWGLTLDEQRRVWWDISWIWGPPDDHLAHLLRTIGAERFVFGSGWPLRLTQTPSANLALLPDDLRSTTLADPRQIASQVRDGAADSPR
jgi:predicted TIM-barrel fold metal-dependent hydrolase